MLHIEIMYQNNSRPTFSWSDELIQSESNLSTIIS